MLRSSILSEDASGSTTNGIIMNIDSLSQYKHWNIFWKDIFKVSIDIVDRETNKVINWQ